MEIGDIYIVNKADRPDADLTYNYIRFAIESSEMPFRDGWKPIVVKTIATRNEGIKELVDKIEEHREFLIRNELFKKKVLNRRMKILELMARKQLSEIVNKIIKEKDNILLKEPISISLRQIILQVKELLDKRYQNI